MGSAFDQATAVVDCVLLLRPYRWQVHYFDHETRYLLGHQWYSQRWPLPQGGVRALGMDGSATYLHSPSAALRIAATLHPSAALLVLLRDPTNRALRRWRELARRVDYTRGASFEAKMLTEGSALSRCFEGDYEPRNIESGVSSKTAQLWERCVASVCGIRGCIMGEGVYAPQLAIWQRTAGHFRWIILPEESLRVSPAEALRHIFASLRIPPPQDLPCLASQLAEWAQQKNDSIASSRLPAAPSTELSYGFLQAFFARYNAPLSDQIQQVDANSAPLWRDISWISSKQQEQILSGPDGLRTLQAKAHALRNLLAERGDASLKGLTVSSAGWVVGPRPSVFVLGARDSGADSVTELLLAQPGMCGGALRLFDDDLRYVNGLPAAIQRIARIGRNVSRKGFSARRSALGGACSSYLDSSPYLHSRWAPLRIYSALRHEYKGLRFIVVLRDPIERAMRHWKSLQATSSRLSVRQSIKRAGGGDTARLHELHGYLNGSSFLKKVRQEASQLQECFEAHRRSASHRTQAPDVSREEWEQCTTVACNWYECVVGLGMYAPQLRGWLRYFDPHQFLLLEAHRVLSEPMQVAKQIQAFLRMPVLASIELLQGKDNMSHAALGDPARRLLQRFYSRFNVQTRTLFREFAGGPDLDLAASQAS